MFQSTRTALLAAVMILLPALPSAWGAVLSGRVIDAETGEPVPSASVTIDETSIGTMTGERGDFTLESVPNNAAQLIVRHVAYRTWTGPITPGATDLDIALTPIVLPGQDIIVTTSRARRGESPVAFDNMTTEEIDRIYHTQDVPQLLTHTPGVYSYSDNGNNIGYSYMSIRGFSQRHVSVLINGVPLNDPETHQVYWIDLPDLPENLQDVQVQRGVGTTLYGSNSIGGTVNLQTAGHSPVREIEVTSGFGSYDTKKYSIGLNSGLIDDKYSLYGRFSRITSDGYRRDAWTDMWSYFFSAARYDGNWTNRVNFFGGPEETHLAYSGIPRRFIEGDTTFEFNGRTPTGNTDDDRRYNPFEWDKEKDYFNQPHFQLLSEYRPDTNWLFENTLFYIKGEGYYDQLLSGTSYEVYELDPVAETSEQLWRRLWLDNDFWGIIPRLTKRHPNGELTVGAEFRRHQGDHWGQVQSVSPAPDDFTPGQRYYDYEGRKTVLSAFAQEVFTPRPWITLTGALQYAFKEYRLLDNEYENINGQTVTHTTGYNFISPRFGVTVRPRDGLTVFGSISYNEQEPSNRDIFDPENYYVNANDFFNNFNPETGEGGDPVMRSEQLVDYELGGSYQRERWSVTLNLYHMDFKDEIVLNGRLDDIGFPISANAPSSTHQGVELSAAADFGYGFSASGNLSINDNTFDEFTEYLWSGGTADRSGNVIAGFPKHLGNLRGTYEHEYGSLSAHLFRAGRQYIDNSNSPETSIDPYSVVNLRGEVTLSSILPYPGLSLFVHVNNVLDEEYETGGYIGAYPLFIPAAKRNFFAGLEANL
ncbi:MAG: TonB-dependent receptor [candidate division Zixibacteria bacterium]|nr:TonB-dependent receptor [candidate division Zixibacteria bacterium]